MADRNLTVKLRGQSFSLLPERCVFWHEKQTLLASDLHWGKVEVFHAAGIPVPREVFGDDLRRLGAVISKTNACRLLILGDLIHARSGITTEVNQQIIDWRQKLPVAIELIKGNHDRGIMPFLDDWMIRPHEEELREDEFTFSHHEKEGAGEFNWSGHVHPAVRVKGLGRESLRFPCFVIGAESGLLPAYSHFTGGQNVRRTEAQKVFAVVEDQVIEV